MNKLIIICNHLQHAKSFLEQHNVRPTDAVIVTPEQTDKLYGHQKFDYYCIRPVYAREKAYLDTHGGMEITIDQVIMGYSQP